MKYASIRNNKAAEVVTEEAYETFNPTVKAMFQEVPDKVEAEWKLVDGNWVEPDPRPEPEPRYKSISKLEFVRLLKEHGGSTNQMVVDAKKDANLEFFWLMFDLANSIDRNDPEIEEGLDALVEFNYLPNGKHSVLNNWPSR